MIKQLIKRNGVFAVALAVGLMLVPTLNRVGSYKDTQTAYFDVAMKAISKKDADTALKGFQLSIATFKNAHNQSWFDHFFMPAPNQELAALAFFQEGNVLAMTGAEPEKVMEAYVNSLRLNSGQTIVEGAGIGDDDVHQYGRDFCVSPNDRLHQNGPVPNGGDCVLLRLQKEAQDTRNNMQALVDQHPELKKMLAQGAKIGNGPGPAQAKNGKRDPQPSQGKPADGASHSNPKAI